jgi:hypothetical protein
VSDINLLLFGCVVSFIAVAGAYIYLRECWTAQTPSSRPEARHQEVVPVKIRDVA